MSLLGTWPAGGNVPAAWLWRLAELPACLACASYCRPPSCHTHSRPLAPNLPPPARHRYAAIILACEIFSSSSTFSYAVTLLGMTKNKKSNGLPAKRDGQKLPKDFDPYK